MKFLILLPLACLAGCSALQGVQEDVTFFLEAAAESGAIEGVVAAVASPSIVTATNAIAGLITLIAGGAGGVYGYKRGKNGK